MQTRKIALVVNHVKMDDEDINDVSYWLSCSASERIAEVSRLRIAYFSSSEKTFPSHIEKVVQRRPL